MAVGVAAGGDDRAEPLLGHAEEPVGVGARAHGVDRDLHPPVGAVLEADGHREARRELPVHLALRRARADRAPRDEIGGVLGGDRIEELAAGRQPELGQLQEEPAGQPEAAVDLEAPVEVGVVDEPLPADGGSRLLEVDAHDHAEVPGHLVGQGPEPAPVVERRHGVVDRARPDHHDEPVVLAVEDARDLLAAAADGHGGRLAERELLEQDRRRQERPEALDAEVAGRLEHGL